MTPAFVSTDWLATNLNSEQIKILHIDNIKLSYKPYQEPRYAQEHIPGAIFVEWQSLAVERHGVANSMPTLDCLIDWVQSAGITPDHHLILYDENGGLTSARAFVVLNYLGLDKVSLLDGHWPQWKKEEKPVSQQKSEPKPSQLLPQLQPHLLKQLREVQDKVYLKALTPEAISLIDSRPEPQYSGEESGAGVPRGGHLPGAVNIHWKHHLQSPAQPLLKSLEELLNMYQQAGVQQSSEIISYCRTGVQACHNYVVLKHLGFEKVSIYDNSFFEWSQQEDTPVETS